MFWMDIAEIYEPVDRMIFIGVRNEIVPNPLSIYWKFQRQLQLLSNFRLHQKHQWHTFLEIVEWKMHLPLTLLPSTFQDVEGRQPDRQQHWIQQIIVLLELGSFCLSLGWECQFQWKCFTNQSKKERKGLQQHWIQQQKNSAWIWNGNVNFNENVQRINQKKQIFNSIERNKNLWKKVKYEHQLSPERYSIEWFRYTSPKIRDGSWVEFSNICMYVHIYRGVTYNDNLYIWFQGFINLNGDEYYIIRWYFCIYVHFVVVYTKLLEKDLTHNTWSVSIVDHLV